MINYFKQIVKPYIVNYLRRRLPITWIKKEEESWLGKKFSGTYTSPQPSTYCIQIEKLAQLTNQKGAQPLWEGYSESKGGNAQRMPNVVRTDPSMGNLYTYLVQKRKPEIIVEFGTAFGVSGMYFLAGLNLNKKGKLLTFDPNTVWAKLAKDNLSKISDRFKLTNGTFEDNIDNVLPEGQHIDIAFIDAIHTKEFVLPQLDIVVSRSKKGTIIILDDINFSDDMRQCWKEVSTDNRFISSLEFRGRIGMLELK